MTVSILGDTSIFFLFLSHEVLPPTYLVKAVIFSWCIPPTPTLSFSYYFNVTHTPIPPHTYTHLTFVSPSCSIKTNHACFLSPPLCFIVALALLLVSLQRSAGYSLNLWLLHNLQQHHSQSHWLSSCVTLWGYHTATGAKRGLWGRVREWWTECVDAECIICCMSHTLCGCTWICMCLSICYWLHLDVRGQRWIKKICGKFKQQKRNDGDVYVCVNASLSV